MKIQSIQIKNKYYWIELNILQRLYENIKQKMIFVVLCIFCFYFLYGYHETISCFLHYFLNEFCIF